MAHFAQLDENNIVIQVIVVHNNELLDNGVESEDKGIKFCQSLFGIHTVWKQTSYNGSFRKIPAGVGYLYNPTRDAFLPPKPYTNWVLNDETYTWESPIPYPTDGKKYVWDDHASIWVDIADGLATPIETL